MKIGIFYGSDTGNTQKIALQIKNILADKADVADIAESSSDDINQYQFLMFGIPTWYYGESQADWDDFYPTLTKMDLTGKTIALFGCGDQEDYAEYFCNAIGELYTIVTKLGATVVGFTKADSYHFEESKALISEDTLAGLCIDEDRQPELTQTRVENWTATVLQDFQNLLNN